MDRAVIKETERLQKLRKWPGPHSSAWENPHKLRQPCNSLEVTVALRRQVFWQRRFGVTACEAVAMGHKGGTAEKHALRTRSLRGIEAWATVTQETSRCLLLPKQLLHSHLCFLQTKAKIKAEERKWNSGNWKQAKTKGPNYVSGWWQNPGEKYYFQWRENIVFWLLTLLGKYCQSKWKPEEIWHFIQHSKAI